jgi:hypothetical protein
MSGGDPEAKLLVGATFCRLIKLDEQDPQEAGKFASLLGSKGGEDPIFIGQMHRCNGVEKLSPQVRECDKNTSAILGIWLTANQASITQVIDSDRDSARCQPERCHEITLSELIWRTAAAKVRQHGEVAAVEPRLGEHRLDLRGEVRRQASYPLDDSEGLNVEIRSFVRPAFDQEIDVVGQPRWGGVFRHRNTLSLECTLKDTDLMTRNANKFGTIV